MLENRLRRLYEITHSTGIPQMEEMKYVKDKIEKKTEMILLKGLRQGLGWFKICNVKKKNQNFLLVSKKKSFNMFKK